MTMIESEVLTIGATLKKRRQELGSTLSAIAEKTRIRAVFLQAMEEDRFDCFPGDAYLTGFLKFYAETLGLDAGVLIDQFRVQTGIPAGGRERKSTVYDLPAAVPHRKSKSFSVLLLTVLLGSLTLAIAYFVFHFWPFAQEPKLTDSPQLSAVSGEFSLPAGNSVPMVVVEDDTDKTILEDSSKSSSVEPVSVNGPESDYAIPSSGGVLRVEALGSVNIETLIDDLPLKQYTLAKDTVLSWRVLKFMQLQVDAPELLKVWFDNDTLDLQGRTQLLLRAGMPPVEEERR